MRLLRELGSAADANSIWEIEVARRAGFAPADIVFTGVGKSPAELESRRAARAEGDQRRVGRASWRASKRSRARAAARARAWRCASTPTSTRKSHPHISTGLKINKFGVPLDDGARRCSRRWPRRPALQLVGVHVHIGSQITTLEPLRSAAARSSRAGARAAATTASTLEYLDLGGGLGISYDGAPVPTPASTSRRSSPSRAATGLPIVSSRAASIVGPAGALLARVVDVKPRDGGSEFAVLDAGMTELMRPALYGAFHRIEPVRPRDGAATCRTTSSDRSARAATSSARDRDAAAARRSATCVAIRDAGAYGSAMASNYNRRPLPAEVLVDDGSWRVIRRRQTLDDMLALEWSCSRIADRAGTC